MKFTFFQTTAPNLFLSKRLIFQGVDKAPPSPEDFKNKEKQSSAAEVASQSPSQIFNDTISAGSAIKTRYNSGTTALANLVKTDPMFTGQGIIPSTSNTGTNPNDPNAATTTKKTKKQK
ncbi:hypothetical protein IT411_04270 [Candidatus Peregrinibacteria bacterium]|nr:hypothetical protein [Candidatus Peregrinibacteria bacterium]